MDDLDFGLWVGLEKGFNDVFDRVRVLQKGGREGRKEERKVTREGR